MVSLTLEALTTFRSMRFIHV